MLLQGGSEMKMLFTIVVFTILFVWETGLAIDSPFPDENPIGTNSYHVAFVDVKDIASESDKVGDATYIRSEVYHYLKPIGMRSTYSEDADVDIHVICRFKHKLMLPVITRGAQIKMTEVGECTLKIIDKKTEKVLIDKSWVRGKKNGSLQDFFGVVFTEFKNGLETNAVPQVPVESAPKTTNSVSLPPPQNTFTNTGKTE